MDAGEALGNRSIRLRVAGETVTTTTDADGRFTVAYWPTAVALNATTLGVEYVPAPDSEYLGGTDTVSVAVEQVTPTLTVGAVPDEVRFGDTVTVSSALATNGDGAFDERVAVPEDLAGEVVTVTVAYVRSVNLAPGRDEATVGLPERQPQEPGGDEAGRDR